MPLDFHHDTLILDASCIITLYASQQMSNILGAVSSLVTVAAYVYQKEALWFFDGPVENVRKSRAAIDLQPIVDAGLLKVATIESEDEAEMYLTLSQVVDAGEAYTGAIAMARNWAIVVDDRKARRVFSNDASDLQLLFTLDLIQHWAETAVPDPNSIAATLWNVRHRAAYMPARRDPNYAWWSKHFPGEWPQP